MNKISTCCKKSKCERYKLKLLLACNSAFQVHVHEAMFIFDELKKKNQQSYTTHTLAVEPTLNSPERVAGCS